jgi:hypothetical protein
VRTFETVVATFLAVSGLYLAASAACDKHRHTANRELTSPIATSVRADLSQPREGLPMIRSMLTFAAELEISQAAWIENAQKLHEIGYYRAFVDDAGLRHADLAGD